MGKREKNGSGKGESEWVGEKEQWVLEDGYIAMGRLLMKRNAEIRRIKAMGWWLLPVYPSLSSLRLLLRRPSNLSRSFIAISSAPKNR
ncbi:hypothetical protein Csa_002102 [Cucumis sativus]|uniref:Uncharacterized protein n=1 Tax=Cucumis sativus TaxID=3659 RepID=A0A0A0LGL3_CUCSA|nr:hypothetical protein Csa_002102 [Cucumis sativus]